MKRKLCCILSFLCLFVTPIAFGGCNNPFHSSEATATSITCTVEKKTDDCLILHVTDLQGEYTLSEAMATLQSKGEISYAVADGMMTTLNGVTPEGRNFWALYTSDEEFSNTAWGSYEYNGKNYGSSSLGMESLAVAEGEYYIWALSSY